MYPSLLPFAPFIGAKNYSFSHEYALRNNHLPFSEIQQKWLSEETYTPEKRDGISIFNIPYTKYIVLYKKDNVIRYVLFYKKMPSLRWEINEKYVSTKKIDLLRKSKFAKDCELYGKCVAVLKTRGVINAEALSHPLR